MHIYPLNQLNGVQMDIIDNIMGLTQINDLKTANNYIERVNGIPKVIENLMEDIKWRSKKQQILPKFYLKICINQIEKLLTSDVKENVLFKCFSAKSKKFLAPKEEKEMNQKLEKILSNKIYPVYEKLSHSINNLLDFAPEEVGLWKMPKGDKIYQILIEKETSTKMTAKEIHNLGLFHVNNIKKNLLKIFETENFPSDFNQAIHQLKNDPRFFFEDSFEGRKKILKTYQNFFHSYQEKCENFFGVVPSVSLQILRVPKYKEDSSAGAYYNPPSMDKKKLGTFCVNLKNISLHPTYGMKTLFFHEGKNLILILIYYFLFQIFFFISNFKFFFFL
jgi:uncharacterized protein (DUF885 family)